MERYPIIEDANYPAPLMTGPVPNIYPPQNFVCTGSESQKSLPETTM